jgi:hypothetical protein
VQTLSNRARLALFALVSILSIFVVQYILVWIIGTRADTTRSWWTAVAIVTIPLAARAMSRATNSVKYIRPDDPDSRALHRLAMKRLRNATAVMIRMVGWVLVGMVSMADLDEVPRDTVMVFTAGVFLVSEFMDLVTLVWDDIDWNMIVRVLYRRRPQAPPPSSLTTAGGEV